MAKQAKQAAGKNASEAKKGTKKGTSANKAPAQKSKKQTGKLSAAKSYLTGVLNELKRVHWPSKRENAIYTTVVVVTVGIIAVLIWIFDLILGGILRFIY